MKTAILSSGGMDSFIAWALTPENDKVNVFVDIKQKYVVKERQAISHLAASIPSFKVVMVSGPDLSSYETPSGIIPNRNAHLILSAAPHGERIVLGILDGEINSDKSLTFLHGMQLVLDISNKGQYWNQGKGKTYLIGSPLFYSTKTEAIKEYLAAGWNPDLLHLTVSCYSAKEGHCGECPSCFKRWVAMTNNGLFTKFNKPPLDWTGAGSILRKCTDGTYGVRRAKEILTAVNHD